MQLLQQFAVPSVVGGNSEASKKDTPIYVGMESHLSRIENEKTKNQNKGKMLLKVIKRKNKIKISVKSEDGLVLVVSVRIHGKLLEH